jgi:hypothetical protein
MAQALSTFDPRSGHVKFLVDKMAPGKVFSKYIGVPMSIPPNTPY